MKILIHDLENLYGLFPSLDSDITVIENNKNINHCIGCFGCWVKTPGSCVIKDDYKEMGKLFSNSDELILISQCFYGGYSPFVKNVLDRSISYMLPYFDIRSGEMHHKSRYRNKLKLTVHFYGDDISEAEKDTAKDLVKSNSINLNLKEESIHFHDNIEQLKGVI